MVPEKAQNAFTGTLCHITGYRTQYSTVYSN